MNIVRRKSSGFTLVEVAVVIFITGILVAISVISFDLVNSSTLSTRNRASAEQVKKIAEIYHSETGSYPGMIQEFYTGGTLAKIPIEASVIADAASSPLNFNTGKNTLAYACLNSCINTVTGGRFGYWDYTTKNIKYIYIGDATAASSWAYPESLTTFEAGGGSTCGVSNLSNLYCWGANGYGQLGLDSGTSVMSRSPKPIDTTSYLMNKNISKVSSGGSFACAVDSKGKAYCWGRGTNGELGNGQLGKYASPQPVIMNGALNGKTIVDIQAANYHTCVIASDSKAYCWGHGANGRLGSGIDTSKSEPTAVDTTGVLGSNNIISIDTGTWHSCAIASNNKAYCWGYNGNGQLGDGSVTQSLSPVEVIPTGLQSGKVLTQISTGYSHSCALANDGEAFCWGLNSSGQLGDGSVIQSLVPVKVILTGALNGKTLNSIEVGYNHTCATTTDGGAYCWGYDGYGELGLFVAGYKSLVPVAVDTTGPLNGKFVKKIATAYRTTCFLTTENKMACSGLNTEGQLGISSTASNNWTPIQIDMNGGLNGLSILAMTNGRGGANCAIASNQRAYCWGYNNESQLGINVNSDRLVPTRLATGALAGKNFKEVKTSADIGCAKDTNDILYCWGYNITGEVGAGTTNRYEFVPVPLDRSTVLAGKTIKKYDLSLQDGCAIASDNLAYCWGLNSSGQLGNGSTTTGITPSQVNMPGVLAGKIVKDIAVGSSFACMISGDDLPYCWGLNTYGTLGDGTVTSSSNPVAVLMNGSLTGLTVKSITTQGSTACVIASNDTIHCWGSGANGALGNNGYASMATPVAVKTDGVMAGKSIIKISSGSNHVCALSSDKKIFCWGFNSNGQLGDGTTTTMAVPIEVSTNGTLKNKVITDITTGSNYTCVRTSTNENYCWGENGNGQFGNATMQGSLLPTKSFM